MHLNEIIQQQKTMVNQFATVVQALAELNSNTLTLIAAMSEKGSVATAPTVAPVAEPVVAPVAKPQVQAPVAEPVAKPATAEQTAVSYDEYKRLASQALGMALEKTGGTPASAAKFCSEFLAPWGYSRFNEAKEGNPHVQEIAAKLKEYVCKTN